MQLFVRASRWRQQQSMAAGMRKPNFSFYSHSIMCNYLLSYTSVTLFITEICKTHTLNPAWQEHFPHLVQLFIKLAELGDFLHDLFPHEEWRVKHGVLLAVEDPQGVIDQSLLQEHQRALNATQEKTNTWAAGLLICRSGGEKRWSRVIFSLGVSVQVKNFILVKNQACFCLFTLQLCPKLVFELTFKKYPLLPATIAPLSPSKPSIMTTRSTWEYFFWVVQSPQVRSTLLSASCQQETRGNVISYCRIRRRQLVCDRKSFRFSKLKNY